MVEELERYLDELAYTDLKAISFAAHNHYWEYFESLSADMQDEVSYLRRKQPTGVTPIVLF